MNMFCFIVIHLAVAGIYWAIMREDATLFEGHYLRAHQIWANFVTFSIMANLWIIIFSDPSPRKMIFNESENIRRGWEVCYKCETYKPHRAIHCQTCRICVLKRDHHCYFAGNCVGYSNMRYFYGLLFYSWIGALYANFITLEFLLKTAYESPFQIIISFIAPIPAGISGYIHEDFLMLMVSTVALIGLVYTSYLVYLHSRSLLSGLTQWEINRGGETYKERYRTDVMTNIRDTFGSNWPIAWISPFIPSKLPQDGTHYPHPKMQFSMK